jgi:hypothetical protein
MDTYGKRCSIEAIKIVYKSTVRRGLVKMNKEIDGDDKYTSPMRAMDIDMDGIWRPKEGERVFDLRDIKFSHHMIDGQEKMTAYFNDPRGYYNLCPSCKKPTEEDDAIIVLENFHYLVMRHCDSLLLFRNKDLKKREWK